MWSFEQTLSFVHVVCKCPLVCIQQCLKHKGSLGTDSAYCILLGPLWFIVRSWESGIELIFSPAMLKTSLSIDKEFLNLCILYNNHHLKFISDFYFIKVHFYWFLSSLDFKYCTSVHVHQHPIRWHSIDQVMIALSKQDDMFILLEGCLVS